MLCEAIEQRMLEILEKVSTCDVFMSEIQWLKLDQALNGENNVFRNLLRCLWAKGLGEAFVA